MSEVQIPAASTRASSWPGPGRGVGTLRTRKWSNPVPSRTSALISAGAPSLLSSGAGHAFIIHPLHPESPCQVAVLESRHRSTDWVRAGGADTVPCGRTHVPDRGTESRRRFSDSLLDIQVPLTCP